MSLVSHRRYVICHKYELNPPCDCFDLKSKIMSLNRSHRQSQRQEDSFIPIRLCASISMFLPITNYNKTALNDKMTVLCFCLQQPWWPWVVEPYTMAFTLTAFQIELCHWHKGSAGDQRYRAHCDHGLLKMTLTLLVLYWPSLISSSHTSLCEGS